MNRSLLHHILLITVCANLLSGCVATAVVAGASALGASALYDPRSFKTMGEDSKITTALADQIATNPKLHNTHEQIKTINHNTLLIGQVTQPEQRILIYKIAKKIPHVKRVYNQLEVGPAATEISKAKDLWIEGRARAALLEKKGLRSAQVKPVVNNGIIYLMGILPNHQQALATDVVRKIAGVKKVVTLFENVS